MYMYSSKYGNSIILLDIYCLGVVVNIFLLNFELLLFFVLYVFVEFILLIFFFISCCSLSEVLEFFDWFEFFFFKVCFCSNWVFILLVLECFFLLFFLLRICNEY